MDDSDFIILILAIWLLCAIVSFVYSLAGPLRPPNGSAPRGDDGILTSWEETRRIIKQNSAILRPRLLTALENGDLPAFEAIRMEAQKLVDEGCLGKRDAGAQIEMILNGEGYSDFSLCLYDAIRSENEELVFGLIDFGAKLPAVNTMEWHSMLRAASDSVMGGIAKVMFKDASQVSLRGVYLTFAGLT